MKHWYLFIILFTNIAFAQQKEYDQIALQTQTKILYDRVFSNSKIVVKPRQIVTGSYTKQVYSEIQKAALESSFTPYDKIIDATKKWQQKNIQPLLIVNATFETLSQEAKLIGLEKNNNVYRFKEGFQDKFNTHSFFIASTIEDRIKGKNITLVLPEDFILNNKTSISGIAYQLDGLDTWKSIQINQPFTISVPNQGNHSLKLKITLSSGEEKVSLSSFTNYFDETSIYNRNIDPSINAVTEVTATIPYQGFGETLNILGKGQYEIFLDNTTQELDKPIFIIDGYDPGDTRNITAIYQSLTNNSGQNLADFLRGLGYDIIIVNFPTYTLDTITINGGADFIQRNAFVLVEIINQINSQKVGDEKNVVIGPSMGGLISRYALRYMEMNNLDHDTRLYISLDSPHLGANIPIGFQHLFNYVAFGPLGNTAAQDLVNNSLKSAAARQMLIDHFEGHLQAGSQTDFNPAITLPTGAPNFRNAFQNELNTMGMPQNTRNVSVSNGASSGTGFGTPGMDVMNYTLNLTDSQRVIINLKYTPPAGASNQVSRIRVQQFFIVWLTIIENLANAQSPSFTSGLDTAPGGQFLIEGLTGTTTGNPQLDDFLDNILVDRFCFIPTLSSLAITASNNWYSPTANLTTPFDNIFVPSVNETHVQGTTENITFIINEIINPPLSNTQFTEESIQIKNPVSNEVEIYSENPQENIAICIHDITGKLVYKLDAISWQGNYTIPVNFQTGIYVVTISNGEQKIIKKITKQ